MKPGCGPRAGLLAGRARIHYNSEITLHNDHHAVGSRHENYAAASFGRGSRSRRPVPWQLAAFVLVSAAILAAGFALLLLSLGVLASGLPAAGSDDVDAWPAGPSAPTGLLAGHAWTDLADATNALTLPQPAYAQMSSTTPPMFSSATLDRGTGVLEITFSEAIDATPPANIDPTKFHIREKSTATGGVTLSAAQLGTNADSATITFTLNAANLAAVNALDSPELAIDPGAVRDTGGSGFGATFDVSTAAFTDSFSVSAQDDTPLRPRVLC